MKDGRYQIIFTTDNGVLGEGVCLFRDNQYVGADFIHSYHGRVLEESERVRISMHCRRHGVEFVSRMNLPLEFDVEWLGEHTPTGFRLETRLPDVEVTLACTGVLKDD